MPETIKKRRKKHLRNLERNRSGRNTTVKMASYSGDNTYYAAPTITFKGNNPIKPQSFQEALEAGEVYEFKSKRRAEKFAFGSWKKGKDRREAMKVYRKFKKERK
jgi:hypothetical protein